MIIRRSGVDRLTFNRKDRYDRYRDSQQSCPVQAGATSEILARCDRAATLPKDDRALLVDLSPEVFASLGLNPRHYPVAVFAGVLGFWATDLWLAVQDLRAMKEKKPEVAKPEPTVIPITANA